MELAMPDLGTLTWSGLRRYWGAASDVISQARQAKASEIHCGALLPEGWIAWLAKRRTGLPYVLYMHGEELNYTASSRELTLMARRVVSGARLIVANSRNTRSILQEAWRVPPERIRLLHPGVDTSYFVPAERDDHAADDDRRQRQSSRDGLFTSARQALGWADRPVVLTVGRLQRRKGQDTMIQALPAIRRAVPDVLHAIAGDGEERARLEALVDELDLRAHVQFLGECDDARLLECYQQCDLFVLANRRVGQDIEGFGMVLLEAQACGKPVLAGASGGTAETMSIPETGLVIDCTSPEPLAMAVIELLQDPVRRRRMGAAARRWVVEHFEWDSLALQAAEIFGISPAADRAEFCPHSPRAAGNDSRSEPPVIPSTYTRLPIETSR
jgi:phosphatidylinositol alpha-1,6-mannosyltransferase